MLHYWLSVVIKSFWDSVEFIGQTKTGLGFVCLLLVLTVGWLCRKHGWRNALKNWTQTSGEGALITLVAFALVFIVHFIFEPYHLDADEKARQDNAVHERDDAKTRELVCGGDLKAASAKAELLGQQVSSQLTSISSFQSTANTQQATFNLCVATLAKINVPEPTHINMLTDNVPVPTKAWKHRTHMLVTTNKDVPVTVVRLICDYSIGEAQAFIVGGDQMIGHVKQLLSNSVLISIQSPPWTTTTPLNIDVWFDEDELGTCVVTRQ